MKTQRTIKLRRALILGNFYNRKVKIVQMINGMKHAISDQIVGLKKNSVITKDKGEIDKQNIKYIYQL